MKTDPKFAELHRTLTKDEFSNLEDSIRKDGILSPIIVWKEKKIVLDGHHRLTIAKNLKLAEFPVKEISFASEDDALRWAITAQLGRRNITADEASELRGKRYLLEKQDEGRPSSAI